LFVSHNEFVSFVDWSQSQPGTLQSKGLASVFGAFAAPRLVWRFISIETSIFSDKLKDKLLDVLIF
jgi:hypothetical protein